MLDWASVGLRSQTEAVPQAPMDPAQARSLVGSLVGPPLKYVVSIPSESDLASGRVVRTACSCESG